MTVGESSTETDLFTLFGRVTFQCRFTDRGVEKSAGSQQRSGAHTADHIELGPLTALSPTDEEASTERTVLAST